MIFELNDKIYSIIDTQKSPAYSHYNLEKVITPDILGGYLGKTTIQVDYEGNMDTFKLYNYNNAPITEYNWYPRIIAENSKGNYYHALIGSFFNEKKQTADEVLTVYGLLSSNDIVSIENQKGKKITDKDFIDEFYNGLFTKQYGGNDFLHKMYIKILGLMKVKLVIYILNMLMK